MSKIFSAYRSMWIITMFDLPTDTKKAQKEAQHFRIFLLDDGFTMMQYSVYSRHCASEDNCEVHKNKIKNNLPPDGEVRVMVFTDKQFERMNIFQGTIRKKVEIPPLQVSMF